MLNGLRMRKETGENVQAPDLVLQPAFSISGRWYMLTANGSDKDNEFWQNLQCLPFGFLALV